MARSVPRLLAISGFGPAAMGPAPLAWARAAVAAGVDAIQLREKGLSDRQLLRLATELRRVVPEGVLLIVNGRADIAVAAGADGVHLPASSVPLEELRRRWPHLLLGRSTHTPAEVEAAQREGADYVVFGPVLAPLSKESALPPRGLEGLAEVCRGSLPVLALGGVTPELVAPLAAAGAAGVAGIGSFREAGVTAMVAAAESSFGPAARRRQEVG